MWKKIVLYAAVFVCSCAATGGAFYLAYRTSGPLVTYRAKIDGTHLDISKELSPISLVDLPLLGKTSFTCTGMTYDSKDDCFWVCDLDAAKEEELPTANPSLVCLTKEFAYLRSIPISFSTTHNLQGLAYDSRNDSLWYTTGAELINIRKDGTILFEGTCSEPYNGLLFDAERDGIWVLGRYHMFFIDRLNNIQRTFKVNYMDQDQLCFGLSGEIWISAGADYKGKENYILSFDPASGKTEVAYRLLDSFAVEGIYFDGTKLYVCNDGIYHDAAIRKDYVAIYQMTGQKPAEVSLK